MTGFHFDTRNYAVSVLALAIVCCALLWGFKQRIETSVFIQTQSALDIESSLRVEMLKRRISESKTHVHFIHATPPIQGIVRSHANDGWDPVDKTDLSLWLDRLRQIFIAYAENNDSIVQIRYIGAADGGRELLRVQRNKHQVDHIPTQDLQRKGQRDYFQKSKSLAPGDLYISDINYNREFGKIEQPYWPTYRASKTVFDNNNEFFGFIIINFFAEPLLTEIASNLSNGTALFLINNEGHFLVHPDSPRQFNFEINPKMAKNWDESFEVSKLALGAHSINIATDRVDGSNYIFSEKIYTEAQNSNRSLKLILASSSGYTSSLVNERLLSAGVSVGVLFFILLLVITFYWKFSTKSLSEIEARAGFEALVSGSTDAIITTDKNGAIKDWNSAAALMFNFDEAETPNQLLINLIINDTQRHETWQKFKDVISGKHTPYFEVGAKSTSGREYHVAITFSPIQLESAELSGIAAIIRDVSDAHQMQFKMESLNTQLERHNEEMESFIYTVSHDLKSPMVTIGGFTKKLQKSVAADLDSQAQRWIERILVNVDHMSALLNDLLDLSSIIRQELKLETCDLYACLDQVSHSLEGTITECNAKIEMQLTSSEIIANQRLLKQCLQNLLSNALNYRSPDRAPHIVVSAERIGNEVALSVQDNGLGIEKQYQDKVWKLFERLDVGEGSGVGLAIVKAAMEKHMGRVELHSEAGLGTRFTLIFCNQ